MNIEEGAWMSFGFSIVEVCDANPAACTALFDLEEEFPGLSVMENSCMNECELCALRPYAFVDGIRIDAPTVEMLLEQIRLQLLLAAEQ